MKRHHRAETRIGRSPLKWISGPTIAGLLDSSSYIHLILGANELTFYPLVLLLKLAVLLGMAGNLDHARRFLPFAAVTLSGILVSSFANGSLLLDAVKPVAVLASVILTLTIVGRDILGYAMGMALSSALVCTGFLASVATGAIETTGDRHDFFAGSHPNLGGELISSTLVMAAFVLRPRYFLPLAVTALYCTFLLQSRTSTIAIIISIACFCAFHSSIRIGWRNTALTMIALILGLVVVGAVFAAVQQDTLQALYSFLFDSVFLVEDQYRGGSSGFSGRDQHWLTAMQVISENPFLGAGPDFAARRESLQPHNWLLYAVSQFGIFGWAMAALFVTATATAIKREPLRLIALIPLLIPWLLNDRFLNFNAYPFVIYILAFMPFAVAKVRRPKAVCNPREAYRQSAPRSTRRLQPLRRQYGQPAQ